MKEERRQGRKRGKEARSQTGRQAAGNPANEWVKEGRKEEIVVMCLWVWEIVKAYTAGVWGEWV